MAQLRNAVLRYAAHFIGTAYVWAGDDPTGFDCSGFVIEVLRSVGVLPRTGDWTADELANRVFRQHPRIHSLVDLRPGCLLFWGVPKARHVEMVWNVIGELVQTIGASGGDQTTVDAAAAARQNAFVKVRPAAPGWYGLNPFGA